MWCGCTILIEQMNGENGEWFGWSIFNVSTSTTGNVDGMQAAYTETHKTQVLQSSKETRSTTKYRKTICTADSLADIALLNSTGPECNTKTLCSGCVWRLWIPRLNQSTTKTLVPTAPHYVLLPSDVRLSEEMQDTSLPWKSRHSTKLPRFRGATHVLLASPGQAGSCPSFRRIGLPCTRQRKSV